LVGTAKSERYTDGQAWGSAHTEARIAFDVSIVEPNSNSYSKRSGSSQSFFNAKAGTRDAERTKVKKYKAHGPCGGLRAKAGLVLCGVGNETAFQKKEKYNGLCTQRELAFVPIIFTTSGGMGEAFHRQIWHPHWKRVEAEDAEMGKSEWVSRRRKLMWMARFGVEIA
jgi:hypothetical protein